MELLPKAIADGRGKLYVTLPEFREAFRQMCQAVEQLPKAVIDRGKALAYPQLHHACVQGDSELVEALLSRGVGPNSYPFTEDEGDEPPLVWLVMAEEMSIDAKMSVASILIRYGADVEEGDALSLAQQLGDWAFANYLEEAGRALPPKTI